MGDRLETFNSQNILEQRHLLVTDCSISTNRAGITAIVHLSCATLPTQEQTSCWSSTAHAQISRYVVRMFAKIYTSWRTADSINCFRYKGSVFLLVTYYCKTIFRLNLCFQKRNTFVSFIHGQQFLTFHLSGAVVHNRDQFAKMH